MKVFVTIILLAFVTFCSFVVYWESTGQLDEEPQVPVTDTAAQMPEETIASMATEPEITAATQPVSDTTAFPSLDLENLLIPVTEFLASNDELQHYVPEQVLVSGQNVAFSAVYENKHYFSGKVESAFSFLYGDFTFRIQPIHGNGLFPAIWMLPSSGVSLPELDIYESIGNTPDQFNGVLHFMNENSQERDYFTHYFDPIPQSYVVGFHWDREKVIWYLNGEEIYRITENVPQKPMYLIMNLAVGGNWAKAPTDTTIFPVQYQFEILEFAPQNMGSR